MLGNAHLPDSCGIVAALARAQFNLDAIKKTFQLLTNIPGSLHRPMLDEVLVAPLRGKSALRPLIEDRQKSQMIAARFPETLQHKYHLKNTIRR